MNTTHIWHAAKFVDDLFNSLDCYFELRLIKDEKVIQAFYREAREVDWSKIRYLNTSEQWNIFFSTCGRSSKSGKAEAVNIVPSLWLDVDKINETQFNELVERIYDKNEITIPSYIIRSGHGVHIYWLLKKPVKINSLKDATHIRGYLHGLANYLQADHCYDLSRVMRLPETINWKYPNEPVNCSLEFDHWENGKIVRYPLSIFDKYWIEVQQDSAENIVFANEFLPPLDVSTLRVSNRIKRLIKEPPLKGERSEAVFAVVKSMQHAGYTPDEVLSILMNYPIGERYE